MGAELKGKPISTILNDEPSLEELKSSLKEALRKEIEEEIRVEVLKEMVEEKNKNKEQDTQVQKEEPKKEQEVTKEQEVEKEKEVKKEKEESARQRQSFSLQCILQSLARKSCASTWIPREILPSLLMRRKSFRQDREKIRSGESMRYSKRVQPLMIS